MMKTPRLAELLALVKAENKEENEVTYDYVALTPSEMNEEDAKPYLNALNFACHKPDIKNIAVTGPYGAGKSSVLLTWSKRRQGDLKIMTVSLADFDMIRATTEIDDKSVESGTNTEKKAKQEKSIEYSILQQILYKARKSDLPYSRIERIADVTTSQMRKMALGLLATVGCGLSGFIFLFPEYFRKKLSISTAFSEFILNIPSVLRIGVLAGGAFFMMFYFLLSKLHRMGIFDRRVSIDKIDLSKGATISTRPSDPSLLNVFIDEIVYFFEKQKYNVVIFEDLDRHNDGYIFIKLREINQIINNSRNSDNHVRFIYAVRDDIFNSPEARTKFFDFVMPVVPVMDSQNAAEHFSSKFTNDELTTTGFQQCVDRIAIFIPDMRVLNSIANEFRLYSNLVNNGENIIRLLSLISYKNLCSRDYHLIDSKAGILYGIINSYVSGEINDVFEDKINSEINRLETQIAEIDNEVASNKSEVIRDIMQVYISEKTQQQLYFSNQNNGHYPLENVIADESLFLSMLKTPGLYVRTSNYGANIASINNSVADSILNEYERRCELLNSRSDGKRSYLEKSSEQLRQQRRRLQSSRLETLIQRQGSEGFRSWVSDNLRIDCGPDNSEGYTATQLDFIYSLLRWGYLSTDYMSYRSVFIPGSLSSNDNDFIRAVCAGRESSATTAMPLERTANVVAKLKALGLLLQDNAWHAGVLLYLLEHDLHWLREIIQIQLEEGEEHRLEQFCKQAFSSLTAEQRIAYVRLMASDSKAASEFLNRLLKMTDKKSSVNLLVNLFCSSGLPWNKKTVDMKYAANKIFSEEEAIPDIVPEGYAEFFTANLKQTGVFLLRIGECKSKQGRTIISVIAASNLWKYSRENLINMLHTLSGQSSSVIDQFYEKPLATVEYYNISFSDDIEKQNSLVGDFFISSKEYKRVEEILNHKAIASGLIQKIIECMNFTVEDVRTIKDRAISLINFERNTTQERIFNLLLDNDRIRANWGNLECLLSHYESYETSLPKWFERNHEEITDIPTAVSSSEMLSKLIDKLYVSQEISNAARRNIISSIQATILSLPENMTAEGAALLIEFRRLAPTAEVLEQLHNTYADGHGSETKMLAQLVFQHPALLDTHPELIFINGDDFDFALAERLFRQDELEIAVIVKALNWIWGDDPEVFSGQQFIQPGMLPQLAPQLTNDEMRRVLLVNFLKSGNFPHSAITQVLSTMHNPDYQVFLSDKAHRSIIHTPPQWQLAGLLESAGFIHSLKWNEARDRIRFVPHHSPVFRRE